MSQFKPAGYNSVSPYLIVKDAAGTLKFLQDVFGVTVLRTYAGDNGQLRHAEVRLDDTVLMFADSAPEWPPLPSYVHTYVEDVDATYARALKAGATCVQVPVKKDDEDKRGGVMDVGGTTWWIATRVEP